MKLSALLFCSAAISVLSCSGASGVNVLSATSANTKAEQEQGIPQRYIIYPKPGNVAAAQDLFAASLNVRQVHHLASIGAVAVDVTREAEIKQLQANPMIERVEKDVRRFAVGGTAKDQLAHLRRVLNENSDEAEAPSVIQEEPAETAIAAGKQIPYGVTMVGGDVTPLAPGTTRENLQLCIIDSGMNLKHPDLANIDVTGSSASPDWATDDCGHGTHVAGTIAADSGDETGVIGVAPGVAVHIVQIFKGDYCQWSWASDLIAATEECTRAARGAKLIVSMSLGGPMKQRTEEDGFKQLWNSGALVIAAAGNDGDNSFSYPASYDSVLSVAAVDRNKKRAFFSQRNNKVDISAPGVNVLSSFHDGYMELDGTSMATPHVSASAALIWSYGLKNGWNNERVRNVIIDTSTPVVSNFRTDEYGHGLVNACKGAKAAGFDPENKVTCPDADLQRRFCPLFIPFLCCRILGIC